MILSIEEQERYSRQILLKGFGLSAQINLKNASVLVVGAGGLGCPCLLYLAAAGVGRLGIVDGDQVSLSNLQRQILYDTADVGKMKSEIAKRELLKKNAEIQVQSHPVFIDVDNCLDLLKDYEVIIDASDNFTSRYLLNDACVILKKPLVYATLYEYEGQISVFNYRGGPTLRCLFPEIPDEGVINNCAEAGVLGILPGMMGTWQAQEAIKLITGLGEDLSGKLLLYNSLNNEVRSISFKTEEKNKHIEDLSHFKQQVDTRPEVDIYTLKEWIDHEPIQLIDVREPYEFEETNIGGQNIPLSLLEQKLSGLDRQQKTVVICQSGIRSRTGLSIIRNKFPEMDLHHLRGGLNAYLL